MRRQGRCKLTFCSLLAASAGRPQRDRTNRNYGFAAIAPTTLIPLTVRARPAPALIQLTGWHGQHRPHSFGSRAGHGEHRPQPRTCPAERGQYHRSLYSHYPGRFPSGQSV
jgi:hypothetical protein